ncbi:MAG: histidine phosphatase family protein [Rhodospirillaceae bacterium]|nr:histidine phosphatase family protein [Rhodospirillaceae bacterium]
MFLEHGFGAATLDDAGMTILRRPFYFLRHGEADWNVERMCIGQLDRPLTDRGRVQAEDARRQCASLKISSVYFSPLSRAAETAAMVMGGRGIGMQADDGLLEACLGVKQGAREDDAADPFLRNWIRGAAIDQAETYAGFQKRVCEAVNRCLAAVDVGGAPLIVAHAGVYHALRDAMNMPTGRVLHCVPYGHHPDGGDWRVEVIV